MSRRNRLMPLSEECLVTEVEFATDGRIYVFGASEQLLSLLNDCGLGDNAMRTRLQSQQDLKQNSRQKRQT